MNEQEALREEIQLCKSLTSEPVKYRCGGPHIRMCRRVLMGHNAPVSSLSLSLSLAFSRSLSLSLSLSRSLSLALALALSLCPKLWALLPCTD